MRRQMVTTGLRWSVIEKLSVSILSLLQLMVVVRYVSQEEIGLMAMVNTILAFAAILSDMGLGNSVLYHQESRLSTIAALFWAYLAMGCLLAIVCVSGALLAAIFFQEPGLKEVFRWSAISLIISGVGQLPRALLYKELAFRELSIINLVAAVVSFLLVVVYAVLGYGVFALVIGFLANALTATVLTLWFGRNLFSLTTRADFFSLKKHLRFGVFQAGESVVTVFSTQFDTIVIGRLLGAEALGLYDIIKRLLARPLGLINPIVTRVITPVLAGEQGNLKRMKALYLKQILFLCSINFPVYIFLALSSEAVIQILLSNAYLKPESTTVFILFCFYFMIYTVQNPIGTLIIASGQVSRSFYYNAGIFLVLPLLLWGAAQYGLTSVIGVMIGFQGSMIFIAQRILLKPAAGITTMELVTTISTPLLISFFAFSCAAFVASILQENSWQEIIVKFFLGSFLYLAFSLRWNRNFVFEARKLLKL